MADVKISGLPAASSAAGAMELEVNDAGTSKKLTVNQLQEKVTGASNGLIVRTAANTTAARAVEAAINGGVVVSQGDGVAGNIQVGNEFASQAEAEAGSIQNKAMNPLRVKQAITANAANNILGFASIAANGSVDFKSGSFTVTKGGTGWYQLGTLGTTKAILVTVQNSGQRAIAQVNLFPAGSGNVYVYPYNSATAQDGGFFIVLFG